MKRLLWTTAFALAAFAAHAAPSSSYYLEDLTWPEVRDRIKAGTDTIIIPSGGTEQNGPHIVIGKHNRIVAYTSGEIAKELGNALAAPVIAYVPEGALRKEGHMAFPGTVTLSDEDFGHLLEDAARSFKLHGFKYICFIGDHGGNQKAQQAVADKLNAEWKNDGVTVLSVNNYYDDKAAETWAKAAPRSVRDPSAHAGFMDTSEAMALDAANVRTDKMMGGQDFATTGVLGDPSKASAEYGKELLAMKVKAAVNQIRAAVAAKK